jgi:hypothetical protein
MFAAKLRGQICDRCVDGDHPDAIEERARAARRSSRIP